MTSSTTSTLDTTAAVEFFAAKLRFETDPTDVAAAFAAGDDFVLVDARGHAPWHQGRIAGAIHMPHAEIPSRALNEIPITTPVVVYCWGPACNGGTRAALQFSKLGYAVKEMIGGFEYWTREGLDIVDDSGSLTRAVDILTTVRSGDGTVSCDC
jgi:rhodanese-related sulfurtransferase